MEGVRYDKSVGRMMNDDSREHEGGKEEGVVAG